MIAVFPQRYGCSEELDCNEVKRRQVSSLVCSWAWPEGNDESLEIVVGADAGSKAAAFVCSAGQCWATVHKALCPGSLALFLLDVYSAGYLVMSSGYRVG
jgi:hypothetical protein